ncbi:hypothetical protein JBKA6_0265 [Ichthyobacterium seriolicida]|uniref:Thioredoxin n=2 Tax=Ichthyobacterium seriolicida TaxID=242600 RepID=A0A1J1E4N2_9FLAO|nr:hypothetical protein JBKA6_0265 [Ichthyobacterium seriolicida]
MDKSFTDIPYKTIDISKNEDLIEKFNIKKIPTVVITKGEEEINRCGIKSAIDFELWLNENIPTSSIDNVVNF